MRDLYLQHVGWRAAVHRVTESRTRLSDLARTHARVHTWDLVSPPGIKPGPPALRAPSLSHWNTRDVPILAFEFALLFISLDLIVTLLVYYVLSIFRKQKLRVWLRLRGDGQIVSDSCM